MTETEFEDYKHLSVNLVPVTDNQLVLDGLNNAGVNITFALVGTAPTTITVGDVNDVTQGTVQSWVFPTPVDGVACINVAGFKWKYIWFTSGASGNSILGAVYAFIKERRPPANNATVAILAP